MIQNDTTQAWKYYERGRAYNNSLIPNQYTLVNTNIEFFAGNQWLNIPETPAMQKLPKPVFNIIKRVTSLFVASVCSTNVAISFDGLAYYDGENVSDPDTNAAAYATAEVRNLLEKFKLEYRIRDALFDGAQTGDYCAHFFWNPEAEPYGGAFGGHKGEIEMEMLDGINVMFGNPNLNDVQKQPYILIIGRDTVDNLREEAKRHHVDEMERESITADADFAYQAAQGGQTELSFDDDGTGKALYCYLYTKRRREEKVTDADGNPVLEDVYDGDGEPVYEKDESGEPIIGSDGKPVPKKQQATRIVTSVFVTKSTKSNVIYENIDTGLSRYPIAWGNWEKQKNQYHGRALVTGLVPNQIFINSMFAMVMRHLQLQSFPKTFYNADLIQRWDNEIGKAIAVRGLQPGEDIRNAVVSVKPADMSVQIVQCIDKAFEYTKECLGATASQLGNLTNVENTSALMVLQSSAEVPLANIRSNLYEWVGDIGLILLDMMGTYYGSRPILRERKFDELAMTEGGTPQIDPLTGTMVKKPVTRRVKEDFDFTQFKNLWLNLRVDVGATSVYSEMTQTKAMDNLLLGGYCDIIQYLERLPDGVIPRKEELVDELKDRQEAAAQSQAQASMAGPTMAREAERRPAGGSAANGLSNAQATLTTLPSSVQARFDSLPKKAQNALGRKAEQEAL